MSDKIWNQLSRCIYQANYLCFFNELVRRANRAVTIFIAIVSSATVGAWTQWKSMPNVWASILWCGQAVMVGKQYIPYVNKIKDFEELYVFYLRQKEEWRKLYSDYENDRLSEPQASRKFNALLKAAAEIEASKPGIKCPEIRYIVRKSDRDTRLFLEKYI